MQIVPLELRSDGCSEIYLHFQEWLAAILLALRAGLRRKLATLDARFARG